MHDHLEPCEILHFIACSAVVFEPEPIQVDFLTELGDGI
jgi:hypothetical protein